MARLDKDRQHKLEGKRIEYAKKCLLKKGIHIHYFDNTKIQFHWKDSVVTLYPYSGWHTGKTIKDGRGLENLLNQLK